MAGSGDRGSGTRRDVIGGFQDELYRTLSPCEEWSALCGSPGALLFPVLRAAGTPWLGRTVQPSWGGKLVLSLCDLWSRSM